MNILPFVFVDLTLTCHKQLKHKTATNLVHILFIQFPTMSSKTVIIVYTGTLTFVAHFHACCCCIHTLLRCLLIPGDCCYQAKRLG